MEEILESKKGVGAAGKEGTVEVKVSLLKCGMSQGGDRWKGGKIHCINRVIGTFTGHIGGGGDEDTLRKVFQPGEEESASSLVNRWLNRL